MAINIVEQIIRTRIARLNKSDIHYCEMRWDMSRPEMERKIWREQSNTVTFARQELEEILKELGLPRFAEKKDDLDPAIQHINASPEFLSNPDNVAAINKMVQLATAAEDVKLLYKKLNALRLEVDSSIVDDIQKTVDSIVSDKSTSTAGTAAEIGELFEKEYSSKTDYFNHRLGLFMELKEWIMQKVPTR